MPGFRAGLLIYDTVCQLSFDLIGQAFVPIFQLSRGIQLSEFGYFTLVMSKFNFFQFSKKLSLNT